MSDIVDRVADLKKRLEEKEIKERGASYPGNKWGNRMAVMLPVEPNSKLFIRVTDDKRQELSDAVTALYTEGVTNSDFIDGLYAVADGMNLIVEEV